MPPVPPFHLLCFLAAAAAALPAQSRAAGDSSHHDICVYGGSPAAVTAAVQARKMGCSVLVVSPDKHLGGLTSGGLGMTDMGNVRILGGLTREFFHRVLEHYQSADAWTFEQKSQFKNKGQHGPAFDGQMMVATVLEPHVAEKVFDAMIAENHIEVVQGRLDLARAVEKNGAHLRAVHLEDGRTITAGYFIDASYEGDLMAKAGVTYAVGREANSLYGETYNGIGQAGDPIPVIDAYVRKGDPGSGLLPRVSADAGGPPGAGDRKVQAYGYRLCLTNVPENRVPIEKPADYRAEDYEIVLRAIEGGQRDRFFKLDWIQNRKLDANNNSSVSMDCVGINWGYPDGDYALREKIAKAQENWQRGYIWTLQTDPRVPADLRAFYQTWGLAKDEFADNGHWPYALYIREARRMVGPYVITQKVAQSLEPAPEPVGLGAYAMDSHLAQYVVTENGTVRTEGGMYHPLPKAYGIDYRALTPAESECDNLLVPVCVSATHAAYGSVRMEPVFMILGQSAATAAALALQQHVSVQALDYPTLRAKLEQDRQVLERWK